MKRKADFEKFKEHVFFLEENNIIKKDYHCGYKKRFIDLLVENNHTYKIGCAIYIKSIIDRNNYCFSNGQFKEYLIKNNITEIDYLKLCNINLCYGYVCIFKHLGQGMKNFFTINYENGKDLYFSYRSVMTSVSRDYKKMMFYYGVTEDIAKKTEDEKFNKLSSSRKGEKNASFGRKGLNAHCYKQFIGTNDPKKEMSKFLKEKNRNFILKWASNNDIDETNFEILRFNYYSMIFQQIHKNKGKEYQEKYDLKTIEEGIYLYGKEKSIKNYDPKNFYNYCMKLLKTFGNEKDKEICDCFNKEENYEAIMSYCCSLRNNNMPKRIKYKTMDNREFLLRSRIEYGFIHIIEKLNILSEYNYENIKIPYFDINKQKNRTYVVDFEILLKNNKRFLIEVKPYSQCIIPEGEILFKKEAAENYAKNNNMEYIFITEKDLKYDLIRKRFESC